MQESDSASLPPNGKPSDEIQSDQDSEHDSEQDTPTNTTPTTPTNNNTNNNTNTNSDAGMPNSSIPMLTRPSTRNLNHLSSNKLDPDQKFSSVLSSFIPSTPGSPTHNRTPTIPDGGLIQSQLVAYEHIPTRYYWAFILLQIVCLSTTSLGIYCAVHPNECGVEHGLSLGLSLVVAGAVVGLSFQIYLLLKADLTNMPRWLKIFNWIVIVFQTMGDVGFFYAGGVSLVLYYTSETGVFMAEAYFATVIYPISGVIACVFWYQIGLTSDTFPILWRTVIHVRGTYSAFAIIFFGQCIMWSGLIPGLYRITHDGHFNADRTGAATYIVIMNAFIAAISGVLMTFLYLFYYRLLSTWKSAVKSLHLPLDNLSPDGIGEWDSLMWVFQEWMRKQLKRHQLILLLITLFAFGFGVGLLVLVFITIGGGFVPVLQYFFLIAGFDGGFFVVLWQARTIEARLNQLVLDLSDAMENIRESKGNRKRFNTSTFRSVGEENVATAAAPTTATTTSTSTTAGVSIVAPTATATATATSTTTATPTGHTRASDLVRAQSRQNVFRFLENYTLDEGLMEDDNAQPTNGIAKNIEQKEVVIAVKRSVSREDRQYMITTISFWTGRYKGLKLAFINLSSENFKKFLILLITQVSVLVLRLVLGQYVNFPV